MRIGVLTAGGDCPGLNAVIRAVIRCASADDVDVLGIKNGWRGLVENDHLELTRASVLGILPRGGTILGTSRLNPLKDPQLMGRLKENLRVLRLDGLIVVGGEGSLSVARAVWSDHEVQSLGIRKTIDNDSLGPDSTFRAAPAVATVT